MPFVALVGPTAVGKTELALRLAEHVSLEVVNADSRQVYRYMDIGTGKPTPCERAAVPHHVYDVVDPDEPFSLAEYQRLAIRALADVKGRGHIALLVGGSGQYVWSLVEGWHVPEVPPDPEFRRALEDEARQHGHSALHHRLKALDPEAASFIQSTNIRRVIRALELHHATGRNPSSLLRRRVASKHVRVIGLSMDRATLHGRADSRIDTMVRHGFADEVRSLLARGYGPTLPSMSSIGYREMADFVTGEIDLDTATARVKAQTRRLIRRQYTWFRPADERIVWLDATDADAAAAEARRIIEGEVR